MKKETSKEIGKGFIALGNLVCGFSIINGFFGMNHYLPVGMITGIAIYALISLYVAGAFYINKGAD